MITLPGKAILFDCDGVLVDSDASVLGSWRRWASDLGFEPDEVIPIVHGRRSEDTVAELLPHSQRAAGAQLIERYEIEDVASVGAIPGAAALVASMPAGTWAVVTSGSYELATARLRAAGLAVPDVLVTAGDVARGKPDPEGYLAAATRLGIDPGDTIVLEDAAAGIEAARAAGVGAVVGVGADGLPAELVVRDLTHARWTADGLVVDGGGRCSKSG